MGDWSMSEPIVYVDRSVIAEGKMDELRSGIRGLVDFIDRHGARPLFYHIYIDEDGKEMSVVQAHPDSASLELHMEVGGPAFARFAELVNLSAIDIYGMPSEKLRRQLEAKARMLGGGKVAVHEFEAGFTRVGVS